jgi:probable rRNA maturation factor
MTVRATAPARFAVSRSAGKNLQIQVTGCAADVGRRLRRAARRALDREGRRTGRVEIAVVSGSEMARQHRRWLGRWGVTDVITFNLGGGDRRGVQGLILICRDVARREAARRGLDWRVEAALYVVHGCLHLCGYDDQTRGDFRRMHRREDEILESLGWGTPFAGRADRAGRIGRPRTNRAAPATKGAGRISAARRLDRGQPGRSRATPAGKQRGAR